MKKHSEKNKVCTQCKVLKPLSEFYKTHKNKHYFSECKLCYVKRQSIYRKANMEQYRISKRKYVELDPERWSEYTKNYHIEHAARICLAVKIRWYLKRLKDIYDIDLGKFSIMKKTDKELQEYHAYLKILSKIIKNDAKIKIDSFIGTRCLIKEDGQKLFDIIHPILIKGKKVELDFENVKQFSSPFFNFAIVNLLKDIKETDFKSLVQFKNLSEHGRFIIDHIIKNTTQPVQEIFSVGE